MPQDRPAVSDAELAVLKALWKSGPGTVRELETRLRSKKWAYTTILTLLTRLREKGFVTQVRDSDVPAHTFKAAITQEQLVGRGLKDLAKRLCEGAKTPLLHALVKEQLSKSELAELRELLDSLEREGAP